MLNDYIERIEAIKNDLNDLYDRSRELSILNTKLEDIMIYMEAYKEILK
jgi:hypothetical protein